MMLYEKNKDRKKFFQKVAKAIGQSDDGGEAEDSENTLGGDVDFNAVLPPGEGHRVGERVPTNSNKSTKNTGDFREDFGDLEDKLCAILLELGRPSPTSSPVGMQGRVPTLGHSNSNVTSDTGAGEARDEDDKYDDHRVSKKKQKKKDKEKEQGNAIDQLAAEMGIDET